MTSIELQQIDESLLPAAVELDQLCFSGLWTLEGYKREFNSPNSDLLAIVPTLPVTDSIDKNSSHSPRHSSVTPSVANTPPLLGLGCYWVIVDEAHITIVAIHPDFQRRGLGQLMVCALLARSRQRGMERATLEVRISNQSALALYKKFGFKVAGNRKGYYTDTGEDALILWRSGLQSADFADFLDHQWQDLGHRLTQQGWAFTLQPDLLSVGKATLSCP